MLKRQTVKNKLLWLLFPCFLLVGCTPNLPTNSMPPIDFRVDDLNKQLEISTPKGWNTPDSSQITLLVENISQEEIAFPVNCNLKIYTLADDNWTEIKKKVQYYWLETESTDQQVSKDYRILSPKIENGENWTETGMSCDLLPDIGAYDSPIALRIFVSGNIISNEEVSSKVVGGYIDVIWR